MILACSTGFMLIVVLIFIQRELFDSRFIVLAGLILAIVYISIARSLIRAIQRIYSNTGSACIKSSWSGITRRTDSLIQDFSRNRKNPGMKWSSG